MNANRKQNSWKIKHKQALKKRVGTQVQYVVGCCNCVNKNPKYKIFLKVNKIRDTIM